MTFSILLRLNNEKQDLHEDNNVLRDMLNDKNREIANMEKKWKSFSKQLQVS